MKNIIRFLSQSVQTVHYSKGVLAAVFVAGITGGASNVAVLAVINQSLAHPGASTRLILSFAAFCLVLSVNKYISQVLMMRLATSTVQDMRLQLTYRILNSPLRRLEQTGPHRLFSAFTEDVPTIMNALAQMPTLCINLMIVAGCLGYMAWLSWKLFLLVIASLALGMAGYHLLEQKSSALLRSARNEATMLLKGFRALINGAKELQMNRNRRSAFVREDIQKRQEKASRDRVAAAKNYAIAEGWGEIMLYLVIGLLLFVFSSFKGSNTVILTGYVLVFLYMVNPLQFILNVYPTISQANISIERIQQLDLSLLNANDQKGAAESESPILTQWHTLELKNACHTYRHEKDGTEFTLGPINLQIFPGEMVFITGGNGSGKTTLIKLISGLYRPEQGQVFLDGKAIENEEQDGYRHLFATVFADYFLFDELHGMRELDRKANTYLSYLQLDHKVNVKDGVLSTLELSQGQRKRLALLVAYLEDRPIYIFDEWAADQDPVFRDVFYRQILPELQQRGKAVIVVTHDDRYYDMADQLVKLEYGRLASDITNPARGLSKASPVN